MDLDAYLAELGRLPPLLTIAGIGDGRLLDALDRAGWQGHVVAFEPDTTLLGALKQSSSYREWVVRDRLRLVEGPHYHGGADALLAFDGVELRALAEPSFLNRYRDETRQALTAMANAVRGVRANAESRRKHAGIYRRNTLLNAPALAREGDVAALAGLAADIPVVIAAAGPSLDRQLEALRYVQNRAVVISVDTALRPLLSAGISPQFVVGVDATSTNAMHLVDLSGAESTWLVAEGSLDPHAIAEFAGRVFACRISRHDPWPWLEGHGLNVGQLRAWGSVVTTAFDLALHMGATTIALAGVDLAFSEGRPYCRGTSFEQLWRRIEDWGTPVAEQWAASVAGWTRVDEVDVHGRMCRTAPHLVAFRDWLVEQAHVCRNVRIINVSDAGILHGSRIEQGSLSALAVDWPVADVRMRIGACWSPHANVGDAISSLDRVTRSTLTTAPALDPPPSVTWRQPDPVNVPLVRMAIPRSRIHRREDGSFTFAFRTRAARRWMASSMIGEPRLYEESTPLTSCDTIERLTDAAAGHFAKTLDEIAFKPLSPGDPRFDGPAIAVEVPADLANYEALPLDFVIAHGL